ncbi:MAG: hypothetical protein PHT34_00015 [Oscillospiraceae bacterium]|nr:hypothetical protein [Oscillospiraceae bacterium]
MKQPPKSSRQQEDLIYRKILILFLAAILLEAAFLALHRLYHFAGTFMIANYIVWTGKYVALAAVAAGIVWAAARWKKGGARHGVRLAFAGLLAFCAFVLIYFFYPNGAKYMSIAIPILVLLGLVYYIYPPEFLVSAVLGAIVLTFLFVYRQAAVHVNWMSVLYAVCTVLLLALILCAWLTFLLRKQGGMLRLGKKQLRVFPKETEYRMIFFSCGLCALSILASLFWLPLAFIAMFVIGAYLFVLAVYYTVKLM